MMSTWWMIGAIAVFLTLVGIPFGVSFPISAENPLLVMPSLTFFKISIFTLQSTDANQAQSLFTSAMLQSLPYMLNFGVVEILIRLINRGKPE